VPETIIVPVGLGVLFFDSLFTSNKANQIIRKDSTTFIEARVFVCGSMGGPSCLIALTSYRANESM